MKPTTKASTLIAISGAMVASLALPASAAPMTSPAKTTPPAAAPSVAQAPLVSPSFGHIGFTGVKKAAPVVVAPVAAPVVAAPVRERAITRASRSSVRKARSVRTRPVRTQPVRTRSVRTQPAPKAAPAPSSSVGGVLGISKSLSGIAYVYGGTTPAGFDCSGFTSYVFRKMGVSLPRTAEAQRQAATSVSDPRVGDLVFFGAPAHHVGIYAGNGMMWDSPHTGSDVGFRSVYSGATYGRV